MTTLSDLTSQLGEAYGGPNAYVTYSSDFFAAATATPNGSGGYTITPADNGQTWTGDSYSLVGGNGAAEQINISIPQDDSGNPDQYAIDNGILQFTITQADGTTQVVYGQILGWNNWTVLFQLYDGYTPSDPTAGTQGSLGAADTTMPTFYLSNTALGSGATPVDGTDVSQSNPDVPTFLDPQYNSGLPLLLDNSAQETYVAGNTLYAPSLVGTTIANTDAAIIGSLDQDPTTLAVSAAPDDPRSETFAQAGLGSSGITVVAAYNDDQVVELQYTNASNQTVDVFGKLIGYSTGDLLFQIYSGYVNGVLTQSAADASMPYVLLTNQALTSVPTGALTGGNALNPANTGSSTPPLQYFSSPNLHDLFGVTASGGITLSSDLFALAPTVIPANGSYFLLPDSNLTQDTSGTPISGNGTEEAVHIDAVFDQWQVVEFTVTGGSAGSGYTFYGQVIGWNGTEIAFNSYDEFSASAGPSDPDPAIGTFVVADNTDDLSAAGINANGAYSANPLYPNAAPLFLNPATPVPNLDLNILVTQNVAFSTDQVAYAGEVQQDPNTLALTVQSYSPNQWSSELLYGTAGSAEITGVYSIDQQTYSSAASGAQTQFQVAEIQFLPGDSSTPPAPVYGMFIGYNGDSLLFQVLTGFDPTTGTWLPNHAGFTSTTFVSSDYTPYLIISDQSLAGQPNGLPSDTVFTSDGLLRPPFDSTPLCFCEGTLISTPTGPVEVERLRAGDLVLTRAGQARPIVWVGHGQVMVSRGRRSAATPVIIRKGALEENVPSADLHVTKAHAFLFQDVLIPAEFLVNHRSIVWDDRAQEVRIYHIELETHDVLLANGAAAESYRDDGNRWLFRNGNPGWEAAPKPPCAPVVTGGAIVDEVWRQLLDRAGPRRALPLTEEPDVHLVVDGQRIDGTVPQPNLRLFRLPASARSVSIASRSAVPAELGIARDPRQLGVALQRVVLRQGTWFRSLDLADPRLRRGFHAYEAQEAVRWTDGSAMLPASLLEPLLADREGTVELLLQLGGSTHYIDSGRPVARVA